MKTLRTRLIPFVALLAVGASALWIFGGNTPALADGTPVKITVQITDSGFQPNTVTVAEGQSVELTFVWAERSHPNDEHTINISGYNLESEQINNVTKTTVVDFVATKSGNFTYKCDFDCDIHDILQHGQLVVTAAGGSGAAAGNNAAALQAAQIVFDPKTGVVVSGNTVSLAAALQGKDGKPISRAEVDFYADRTFLGRSGQVQIARATTGANGIAYAIYHPTDANGGKITARFGGGGVYDKAEQTVELAPSPQYQPIPLAATDDGLHGMKQAAHYGLVALIGLVWCAFAFMLYQAWGISRVRQGGGPSTHR